MASISTEVLQSVFMGTTALFAGMGVTISVIAAPALMDSTDPLPVFKKLYNRGKNIAFSTIFPSAIAGTLLYYRLDDSRYLTSAVCNILVIPVTGFLMMPINNVLLNMKPEESNSTKTTELLERWSNRQLLRTLLSVTAFAVGVHAILFKK